MKEVIITNLHREWCKTSLAKHSKWKHVWIFLKKKHYLKRVHSESSHMRSQYNEVILCVPSVPCSSLESTLGTNIPNITSQIAHLPHPWLPILTLKSNMRMSMRMLCGGEEGAGGSYPPVCLYLSQRPSCWCDCIYENTRGGVQVMRIVCVQGALKITSVSTFFMLRGPALFSFLREADRLPVFVRFSVEAASSQTGEGRRKAET